MRSLAQQILLVMAVSALLSAAPAAVNGHEYDTKSAWLPEVEQLYRPDVHYSQAAAIDWLARILAENMKGTPDVAVNVRCADAGLCREVEQAIARAGLQPGSTGVMLVAHVSAGENLEQVVSFRVDDPDLELSAPFVTKPWVADTPRGSLTVVRGLAAGDIVGKSGDVIAQAIDTEILPRIRAIVGEKQFPGAARFNKIASRRLKEMIEDSPIVVDRFRQTFYTSIEGEEHVALVREAVLLDVSEKQLKDIVRPIVQDLHRARGRRSTAIGFAAMALTLALFVCCIGYTFFNRVTQGYYVWSIRFAAAALFAVSVTLAARIAISILNSM